MIIPERLVRFWIVLVAVGCLTACSPSSSASDDAAARVNGKMITDAELDQDFRARTQSAEEPPSQEETQDLKLQLLNQLIMNNILMEMAAEASLTATDAEVDVKYNEFRNQYTEEGFQELLEEQGVSVEDIREEFHRSLTVEKLINKEITSKISVSETEIENFYNQNKASFNLPESYRIAHILVTPVEDPEVENQRNDDAKSAREAQQKARRLLRQVQSGADFATVAREYSEDPASASGGGDLDFQPLQAIEDFDPSMAEAIQRLKVGETRQSVIETRFGFHIIKLLEKDPGGQKDLSDPRIPAQIRQLIFNRKDQTLKAAFFELARNNADIENYFARRILETTGAAQ